MFFCFVFFSFDSFNNFNNGVNLFLTSVTENHRFYNLFNETLGFGGKMFHKTPTTTYIIHLTNMFIYNIVKKLYEIHISCFLTIVDHRGSIISVYI